MQADSYTPNMIASASEQHAKSLKFEATSINETELTNIGGTGNFQREVTFSIDTVPASRHAYEQLGAAYEDYLRQPHGRQNDVEDRYDPDSSVKLGSSGAPELPSHVASVVQLSEHAVALGQYMINAINSSFLAMAKNGSGVKNVAYTQDQSSIDGRIAQLSVELDTTKSTGAFLYLIFKKGTAKLSPTPSGSDTQTGEDVKSYDMKGWQVVFSIDIASSTMTTDDSDYSTVSGHVSNASNYSLLRLLLDFTTAKPKEYSSSKSIIPDVDSERLTTFLNLLNGWCQQQTTKVNQTFAYAWTSANPQRANAVAPTFVATSMKLQTWKSSQVSQDKPIPGGRNLLLYLEMAYDRVMPSYTYSSNEELVREDSQGSMFLCKHLFWDRYLLEPQQKILQQVNQWTHIVAVSASCDYSFWGDKIAYFVYRIGRDWSKGDSFYKWKPYLWLDNVWYWVDSSEKSATGGGSAFGMKAEIKCYTSNCAYYQGGDRTIYLEGTSSISTQVWVYTWGIANWIHVRVEVNWSFQLYLGSVNTGKLEIDISKLKSEVKTYEDSGSSMPVAEMEKDLQGIINSIKLGDMGKEIEMSLSGNTGFVLPGGNVFFQKDPIVSGNGDLVVALTYKDNVEDGGSDTGDSDDTDSN
ncbi:hypothetical protein CC80DRAFT_510939 [Byssothecium circinans]|uniref:Uncharacterized protein n=1 Tax=Byssothecium circinans TaxID=147558 RepID=A0A6A5T8N4_9PLEO|nr:hypothetical protein CC80DRAFT_510939 [Byssothecium circinans]